MDYMFSERSRISFRYGQTPWVNFSQLVWGNNAGGAERRVPSTRVARNWGADWTYTLAPTWSLTCAAAWPATKASAEISSARDSIRAAGISGHASSRSSALQFPRFNIGTYSRSGARYSHFSYSTHDSLQPAAQCQPGHARHTIKTRGGIPPLQSQPLQAGAASGTLHFQQQPGPRPIPSGRRGLGQRIRLLPAGLTRLRFRRPQHRYGISQQLFRAVPAGRFQGPSNLTLTSVCAGITNRRAMSAITAWSQALRSVRRAPSPRG